MKFGECGGRGVADVRTLSEERKASKGAGPTSRERAEWGLGKDSDTLLRLAL